MMPTMVATRAGINHVVQELRGKPQVTNSSTSNRALATERALAEPTCSLLDLFGLPSVAKTKTEYTLGSVYE